MFSRSTWATPSWERSPRSANGSNQQGDYVVIKELLREHCAGANPVIVEVRPGRYKVTVGHLTRTVLVYKRSTRYTNDFIAWLRRVCC